MPSGSTRSRPRLGGRRMRSATYPAGDPAAGAVLTDMRLVPCSARWCCRGPSPIPRTCFECFGRPRRPPQKSSCAGLHIDLSGTVSGLQVLLDGVLQRRSHKSEQVTQRTGPRDVSKHSRTGVDPPPGGGYWGASGPSRSEVKFWRPA